MTFGENIRRLMDKRGFTLESLSKQCEGYPSAVYIYKITSNQHTPSWSIVCRLADALGISLDDLRDGKI